MQYRHTSSPCPKIFKTVPTASSVRVRVRACVRARVCACVCFFNTGYYLHHAPLHLCVILHANFTNNHAFFLLFPFHCWSFCPLDSVYELFTLTFMITLVHYLYHYLSLRSQLS